MHTPWCVILFILHCLKINSHSRLIHKNSFNGVQHYTMIKIFLSLYLFIAAGWPVPVYSQSAVTASFVATLGTDTVIVETYNMLPNHLYGKAFLRYPQDQVGIFDFHFYPDGSIRHYSIAYMNPDSPYATAGGTQGLYCENDSCTWFASWPGNEDEYVHTRYARQMDFVGGWTPTLSLIEWNCMRLIKSGKQSIPITMINDYIGIRQVAVTKGNGDNLVFGGDFLEYARIKASPEGRILSYDGTGTPWNYTVTKLPPIDVDEVARRMSKKPKIGIPSPEVQVSFPVAGDTIQLSYGRPSKRGRKIFGGIVPYDSVWRTGAGHPTLITLPYDTRFGETFIPKGSYALYTIPRPGRWSLVFNTDLKEWPTAPNRSKDFAIVDMQVVALTQPTDPFTISIDPVKNGGLIKMAWDSTEARAEFKVVNKK